MRRILLLAVLFCTVHFAHAQDPNIYGTWYLYSYEYDLGDFFLVADIEPPIAPDLIIENDLTYHGNAACNGIGGVFSYDPVMDVLNIDEFFMTQLSCDFQSHEQFENDYSGFFTSGDFFYYFVSESSLQLEFAPGFAITYGRDPLSVDDNVLNSVSIYPNPVKDELFISSEEAIIDGLTVFSITGQQLIRKEGQINSLDVSSLSEGIYLLKLISEGKTQVQKFIKQ